MIQALLAVIFCSCSIGGGADAQAPAVRLTPPPTTAPADPCVATQFTVNGLAYEWGNLDPVRVAYRSVAQHCLGWTPAQVSQWEAFIVDDVIKEESGGCWNVLRKGQWRGTGCEFSYPNGAGEDAGFFQLISIWYEPGAYLCANFGYCGRSSIVASPFDSMRAGLLVVMYDGSRPWCYDARARNFHPKCSTVPRNWGAG